MAKRRTPESKDDDLSALAVLASEIQTLLVPGVHDTALNGL